MSGTVLGEKLIVGGEKGALRVWEGGIKGLTEGTEKRTTLQKDESLDVMCPISPGEDWIAVGLGDGSVRFVQVGGKGACAVEGVKHDEVEGVVTLAIEPEGRMISGGGSIVKIWERKSTDDMDDEKEEEQVDEPDDLKDDQADGVESDQSQGESSEEERRPKRKKRKRNKGKDRGGSNHIMAFKGMD